MARILCDVDGVLLDFIGALCTQLNARGFSRVPADVKHWDLRESFTSEESRETLRIMGEPGFCHEIPWYEGAKDFLTALKVEHEAHILTAPFDSPSWIPERKASLAPWFWADRIHFIPGKWKHIVSGDVLVEDHPGTAAEWVFHNPQGIALLIDRPWNQPGCKEWVPDSRIYRVKSYQDALTTIRECA
jgi:5'(3')-deoxyribonucleotidase